MSTQVKFEHRYFVLKKSDVQDSLNQTEQEILDMLLQKVDSRRKSQGRGELAGVFIEHNWPEFPFATRMLSDRIAALNSENSNVTHQKL